MAKPDGLDEDLPDRLTTRQTPGVAPMMLLPDAADPGPYHDITKPQPYTIERGTCPRCGSGEVIHFTFGLPAGPNFYDFYPDWVRAVGCIAPLLTRGCDNCGFEWNLDESGSMILESEARLYELADATNDEQLGSWIDSHLELTAWAERRPEHEGGIVVRIANRAAVIDEFPTTLAEFWDYVTPLEDSVIEAWDEADREEAENWDATAGND